MRNREFTPGGMDKIAPDAILRPMTKKKFRRTFIMEWRKHRGLVQEQLAEKVGVSVATISRVEAGKTPYNQELLESIAKALECEPTDLLSFRPTAPDEGDVIRKLHRLTDQERAKALKVLDALHAD